MSVYENYEDHLCGVYRESIISFIKQNQVLGLKYHSQIQKLTRFDHFSLDFPSLTDDNLDRVVVDGWVHEPDISNDCMRRRAILLLQFGEYMIARGKKAYLYPKRQFKAPAKYSPFIFSYEQIKQLLACADTNAAEKPMVKSRIDTPLILRMLYGCGLRISEATNLKFSDVDLKNGVLRIIQSKFKKDRMVPMSGGLTSVCKDYADKHLKSAEKNDFFFSADGKRAYSTSAIYHRFREALWAAKIPHRGKGNGPRLHDLRHTFAVHSLKQLSDSGTDLYVSLPVLSAYLGHNSVSATQWYLSLTAEVYPDVMKMVDGHFGDIYPEIGEMPEVCYE